MHRSKVGFTARKAKERRQAAAGGGGSSNALTLGGLFLKLGADQLVLGV